MWLHWLRKLLLCACVPTHKHTHMYMCTRTHTHTHVHTHTHATHTHTHTHTHVRTHMHTHPYAHTCTHTHTHMHTHTNTRTHTPRRTDRQTHTHTHTELLSHPKLDGQITSHGSKAGVNMQRISVPDNRYSTAWERQKNTWHISAKPSVSLYMYCIFINPKTWINVIKLLLCTNLLYCIWRRKRRGEKLKY